MTDNDLKRWALDYRDDPFLLSLIQHIQEVRAIGKQYFKGEEDPKIGGMTMQLYREQLWDILKIEHPY